MCAWVRVCMLSVAGCGWLSLTGNSSVNSCRWLLLAVLGSRWRSMAVDGCRWLILAVPDCDSLLWATLHSNFGSVKKPATLSPFLAQNMAQPKARAQHEAPAPPPAAPPPADTNMLVDEDNYVEEAWWRVWNAKPPDCELQGLFWSTTACTVTESWNGSTAPKVWNTSHDDWALTSLKWDRKDNVVEEMWHRHVKLVSRWSAL